MEKVIGILGGMGPLATSDIFKRIITYTDAKSDKQHIHIIVDNNTKIPDRTNYILNGGENPNKEMIRSAIKLELMGADVIVIPCNTAHYFYKEVSGFVDAPIINMIEETAKAVKASGYKRAGLLATEGTYSSGIYKKVLADMDLELVEPEESDKRHITELIYTVKEGAFDIDITGVLQTIEKMKQRGAEVLILGCTELPIAFEKYNIKALVVDPTEILARRAVERVKS